MEVDLVDCGELNSSTLKVFVTDGQVSYTLGNESLSNMFARGSNTLPSFVRRGDEAKLVSQVNAAVARSYRSAKKVRLHPLFEDVVAKVQPDAIPAEEGRCGFQYAVTESTTPDEEAWLENQDGVAQHHTMEAEDQGDERWALCWIRVEVDA
jgi:hypothetical protein